MLAIDAPVDSRVRDLAIELYAAAVEGYDTVICPIETKGRLLLEGEYGSLMEKEGIRFVADPLPIRFQEEPIRNPVNRKRYYRELANPTELGEYVMRNLPNGGIITIFDDVSETGESLASAHMGGLRVARSPDIHLLVLTQKDSAGFSDITAKGLVSKRRPKADYYNANPFYASVLRRYSLWPKVGEDDRWAEERLTRAVEAVRTRHGLPRAAERGIGRLRGLRLPYVTQLLVVGGRNG